MRTHLYSCQFQYKIISVRFAKIYLILYPYLGNLTTNIAILVGVHGIPFFLIHNYWWKKGTLSTHVQKMTFTPWNDRAYKFMLGLFSVTQPSHFLGFLIIERILITMWKGSFSIWDCQYWGSIALTFFWRANLKAIVFKSFISENKWLCNYILISTYLNPQNKGVIWRLQLPCNLQHWLWFGTISCDIDTVRP